MTQSLVVHGYIVVGNVKLTLTWLVLNKAFPPPSSPCNVVLLPKLPEENSKHANFEWRGGGRAVDCFVFRSYPI